MTSYRQQAHAKHNNATARSPVLFSPNVVEVHGLKNKSVPTAIWQKKSGYLNDELHKNRSIRGTWGTCPQNYCNFFIRAWRWISVPLDSTYRVLLLLGILPPFAARL